MQQAAALRAVEMKAHGSSVIERVRASKEHIENLVDMATMKKAASDRYNEAVKDVAEKLNLDATALKQYIGAIVGDKLDEFEARAEQLSLFVDEKP